MTKATRHGLIILNTGNGKGKTTAALGLLLRAWGRGLSVAMFQFIKPPRLRSGEHLAAQRLGIPITPLGRGRGRSGPEEAQRGWERCREAIYSGQYHMVVLDELTYPLNYGWLPLAGVIEALRGRPPGVHVVITGRQAPPELVGLADLVTEMQEVKHPLKKGLKAQPGIEF
jgi:cob(I)alamin adenosyltransferase